MLCFRASYCIQYVAPPTLGLPHFTLMKFLISASLCTGLYMYIKDLLALDAARLPELGATPPGLRRISSPLKDSQHAIGTGSPGGSLQLYRCRARRWPDDRSASPRGDPRYSHKSTGGPKGHIPGKWRLVTDL